MEGRYEFILGGEICEISVSVVYECSKKKNEMNLQNPPPLLPPHRQSTYNGFPPLFLIAQLLEVQ